MHKTKNLKSVGAAVGAAFAGSMMLSGAVNAAENPFGLAELGSGYMQVADGHMEGKCGEGKCGGAKAASEGKCGEGKCGEGKCGGDKTSSEGKCGGKTSAEGKCGEGKCGGAK
jgi:uncharacterized low-complexity protein